MTLLCFQTGLLQAHRGVRVADRAPQKRHRPGLQLNKTVSGANKKLGSFFTPDGARLFSNRQKPGRHFPAETFKSQKQPASGIAKTKLYLEWLSKGRLLSEAKFPLEKCRSGMC